MKRVCIFFAKKNQQFYEFQPCEKVDSVVTSHMKDHANVAFITGVRDIAAM